MAITSVEDNVASVLNSDISDTSEQLTVPTEFIDMTVPVPGYLIIGQVSDLQPNEDGSSPTSEVAKYDTFSRNGNGTSTFGETTNNPLTRGVGNTNAQSWNSGTRVGLGISAEYMNLIFDAIVPQDNGKYVYQNIHSNSEINNVLVPGGVNELSMNDWYEKGESGVVLAGDVNNLITTHLANNETLYIDLATLIKTDGQPAPSELDMVIATLNNTGGATKQTTIVSGDGSTVYDKETGDPLASYQNTSGAGQSVMVGVDNGYFNAGTSANQSTLAGVLAKVY